jgi:hypothetical protein
MEKLGISNEYRSGIKKLITLSDEANNELLDALNRGSPAVFRSDFVSSIASHIKRIEINDLTEIMNFLFLLSSHIDHSEDSIGETVITISENIASDDEFSSFSDEEKNRLYRRLTKFLELGDALNITSKAIRIVRDHERVFNSSVILTDIRPVFKSAPGEGIAAAAIVHMLKIEYRDLEGTKEFFVALDELDIFQLLEQFKIASQEADAIKMMLKKSEVPFLDVLGELEEGDE